MSNICSLGDEVINAENEEKVLRVIVIPWNQVVSVTQQQNQLIRPWVRSKEHL